MGLTGGDSQRHGASVTEKFLPENAKIPASLAGIKSSV
jgi:hypothetical protein